MHSIKKPWLVLLSLSLVIWISSAQPNPTNLLALTPNTLVTTDVGVVVGAPEGALTTELKLTAETETNVEFPPLPIGLALVDVYTLLPETTVSVVGDVPLIVALPYEGEGTTLKVGILEQLSQGATPEWVIETPGLQTEPNLAAVVLYGLEEQGTVVALLHDNRPTTNAGDGAYLPPEDNSMDITRQYPYHQPDLTRAPWIRSLLPSTAVITTGLAVQNIGSEFSVDCNNASFARAPDQTDLATCENKEAQIAMWLDGYLNALRSVGFREPALRRYGDLRVNDLVNGGTTSVSLPGELDYVVDVHYSESASCQTAGGSTKGGFYAPKSRRFLLCISQYNTDEQLRITTAHELFHAVQYRYLPLRLTNDPHRLWFVEGTAALAGGSLALGSPSQLRLDPKHNARTMFYSERLDEVPIPTAYHTQHVWKYILEQQPSPGLASLIPVFEAIATTSDSPPFLHGSDQGFTRFMDLYASWVAQEALGQCGFTSTPPIVTFPFQHDSQASVGPMLQGSDTFTSLGADITLVAPERPRVVVATVERHPNDTRPRDPIAHFQATTERQANCPTRRDQITLYQPAGSEQNLFAVVSYPNLISDDSVSLSSSEPEERAQVTFEPLKITMVPTTAHTYEVEVDSYRDVSVTLHLESLKHVVAYGVDRESDQDRISFTPGTAQQGELSGLNARQEVALRLDCRGAGANDQFNATLIPYVTTPNGDPIEEGIPEPLELTLRCTETPKVELGQCAFQATLPNGLVLNGSFDNTLLALTPDSQGAAYNTMTATVDGWPAGSPDNGLFSILIEADTIKKEVNEEDAGTVREDETAKATFGLPSLQVIVELNDSGANLERLGDFTGGSTSPLGTAYREPPKGQIPLGSLGTFPVTLTIFYVTVHGDTIGWGSSGLLPGRPADTSLWPYLTLTQHDSTSIAGTISGHVDWINDAESPPAPSGPIMIEFRGLYRESSEMAAAVLTGCDQLMEKLLLFLN
ncbi:MAG: hypothetical protein AAF708_07710 [Deinococcota bacterium]